MINYSNLYIFICRTYSFKYILPELCTRFPQTPGYVQETQFLKSWQSESIYGNEMIVDDFSHTLPAMEPPPDHYFQKVASLLPFCSCTDSIHSELCASSRNHTVSGSGDFSLFLFPFFLLLRYNWHVTLPESKMYITLIWYNDILQNGDHFIQH